MTDTTIQNRKNTLLAFNEVELAIEGRFTNLRIFLCNKDNKVRFRLDKYNQYSCPLSNESVAYLDRDNEVVSQLNRLYGFEKATIEDIDTILELTSKMVNRPCLSW